jgi:menaquinone-dependent protoporphyrinogen oxidase
MRRSTNRKNALEEEPGLVRRILIAYDSGYGTTGVAARMVAEALNKRGSEVDVRPIGTAAVLGYDAVVVGSPIRLGRCSSRTRRFLKRNRNTLAQVPVAFFFTCMSVTRVAPERRFPFFIDPAFSASSRSSRQMKFMERTHTASYYLGHFLDLIPGIEPLGIAFFKGNLQMARLSSLHRLLMRFAIFSLPEIQEGEFLDSDLVSDWAEDLAARLEG